MNDKTLIIGNTASQGHLLQKEIENSDLVVSNLHDVCFYGKDYILFPKSRIGKVLWLIRNLKKYNNIILHSPSSNFDWLICKICNIYKVKITLYMVGSETRTMNKHTQNCIKMSDVIWYATQDLKKSLPEKAIHKPAIPIKYSNKKKILIFSRNDEFKKTHLYFPEIKINKEIEYYFLDWFRNNIYRQTFIKLMPENSFLISQIPKDLVYFVLNGFDEVKGQRSGQTGVSEKEIEEYRKCN